MGGLCCWQTLLVIGQLKILTVRILSKLMSYYQAPSMINKTQRMPTWLTLGFRGLFCIGKLYCVVIDWEPPKTIFPEFRKSSYGYSRAVFLISHIRLTQMVVGHDMVLARFVSPILGLVNCRLALSDALWDIYCKLCIFHREGDF